MSSGVHQPILAMESVGALPTGCADPGIHLSTRRAIDCGLTVAGLQFAQVTPTEFETCHE